MIAVTDFYKKINCIKKLLFVLLFIYRFNALDMEIHSRCRYDFVAAFNGNSTHTPDEIGRYCGNQTRVPPVLKSQSNTMTVQFKTDRSVTARGSVLRIYFTVG